MKKISTDKKISIIGTGGFAREVFCLLRDSFPNQKFDEWVCFLSTEECDGKKIMGIDVLHESKFKPELFQVLIGVGDPNTRKKIVEKYPVNTEYPCLIHPNAVVSDWVTFGDGAIVTAGSILTCNIEIGRHAHINLHTTIGHDCKIGDYFTSGPGANISGECEFGNCVYVGTNAAIKQGIKVASNSVIGMGSAVVKHINETGIYAGVPAVRIK